MNEEVQASSNSSFIIPRSSLRKAEGVGVEPTGASSRSDSFRDCSACPCPTFLELAGTPGLEPGSADLEFAGLASNVRPFVDASGRTRTSMPRSGATALQTAA